MEASILAGNFIEKMPDTRSQMPDSLNVSNLNRMLKSNLLLLTLFFSVNAFAQREEYCKKYKIDRDCEKCLSIDENGTTQGMIECHAAARDAWDKEMNKYYKQLMPFLQPIEKEQLKKAQKNWLAYRDNEFLFMGELCDPSQGTFARVYSVARQVEIVRQRALELKLYYEFVKNGGW